MKTLTFFFKKPPSAKIAFSNLVAEWSLLEKPILFYIAAATICLFSLIVRIPFYSVPIITDEGGAAYVAQVWPNQQMLYKEINYDRFVGFFLIYKVILATLGHDVQAIRLGIALYTIGTLLTVMFFVKRVSNALNAIIAGFLFSIFVTSPSIEGFTANAEMFALFPLTLCAYVLWKKQWWLAGLFAGLAVFFKPIGISGYLLILIWGFTVRARLKDFLIATLSFSLFPCISAIHGYMIGWQYYWDTFVTYRLLSYSLFSQGYHTQLAKWYSSLMHSGAILLLLTIPSTVFFMFSSRKERQFLTFWLLTSLFGMTLGGEWNWHYYVQIIPPLCVSSALGLSKLTRLKMIWRIVFGICTVLVTTLCYTTDFHYYFKKPKDISWELYHRPEYIVSEEVSRFVKQHTSPSDKIYVAFGQADLYFQTGRLAAVPQQLYWNQIEQNQSLWNIVLKSIQEREPQIVIWVQSVPHWGKDGSFHKAISEGYTPVLKYPFMAVFQKKSN